MSARPGPPAMDENDLKNKQTYAGVARFLIRRWPFRRSERAAPSALTFRNPLINKPSTRLEFIVLSL
jgi:hypothetical protein